MGGLADRAVVRGLLARGHADAIAACMQYTIRGITRELDRAFKARARKLGKSVNRVVLEALAQSVGQRVTYRDLRRMPGAFGQKEAADMDRFLDSERRIDGELWK